MQDILTDFGYMAILLMAGYYLRVKVRLFQKLYLPASVIGGVLGLLLGSQVLGKVCPVFLSFSDGSGSYATLLLGVVFTTMSLGARFNKKMLTNGFNFLMLTSGLLIMQVVLGFGVTKLLQTIGSQIPLGFAMLPSTGFYGGHGLGATVAAAFESIGYWNTDDVISISTTFATIGILYGIIGGIFFINIGVRKGFLNYTDEISKLPEEEQTGYIRPENREKFMVAVSTGAVDPLSVQMCGVLIIMLLGFGVTRIFSMIPYLSSLNFLVGIALVAVAATFLCNKTKLGEILHPESMRHITTMVMDFLIVISIANTNLNVIVSYGMEIIVATLIVLAIDTLVVFACGKLFFKSDWFEHAITAFGISSGVVATGLLLLHVADPKNESSVMTSFPMASLTSIVTQTFCLCIAPVLLINSTNMLVGGCCIILVIMFIAALVVARIGKE